MDYTSSDAYTTDVATGRRLHQQSAAVTTEVTDVDMNGIIWELVRLIELSGITPAAFNKTVASSYEQVAAAIQSGNLSVAATGGTNNAITLTFGPTAVAFGKGPIWWRAPAANTSTTPTVQRDGLAAKTLVKGANAALANGDIPGAGAWMCSIYDPVLDKEVLINPAKGVTGSSGNFVGQFVFGAINDAPTNTMLADGSSLSATTYAALFAALVKYSVVTISLATPGVIAWANHGRKANDPIKFTSTGVLPTGLATGTTYYVVGSSITTNTFTLSATPGGAAIATSGAPSGIHTAIYAPHGCADNLATFNLPDRRGEFIRGWDANRGVDANRPFGSWRADTVGPHIHPILYGLAHTTLGGSIGSSPSNNYTGATGSNSGAETAPRNFADAIFIIYQA